MMYGKHNTETCLSKFAIGNMLQCYKGYATKGNETK
jgi:hypothetical protein